MEGVEVSSPGASPQENFWTGRRVLVTGHSGFKGGWLVVWLQRLGANIIGISLPPNSSPNLFTLAGIDRLCESHFCDIRNASALADTVRKVEPEIVFHLAAQPLVRASYRRPVETFETNLLGTVNVLDALRSVNSARVAVMITTDKVYQNMEWPWPYRESDALGGHDPYSASKAACEIAINSYRASFLEARGASVASARAGNVIGGGDWSDDRLIPDAIRAWQSGSILDIRRPEAVRPWQHVLEPLAAYLILAEQLWDKPALAGPYNFGPLPHEATTVREVINRARIAYGSGEVRFSDVAEGPHEAGYLALETSKARAVFNTMQRWDLEQSIQRTMDWYRQQKIGGNSLELCLADIEAFEASA